MKGVISHPEGMRDVIYCVLTKIEDAGSKSGMT